MATTAAGQAATTAHRVAQARLAARVVAEVLALWQSLDPLRLTEPGWIASLLATLLARRTESAELASRYYRDFRAAELEAGPPLAVAAGLAASWRAQAATSLRVTGTRRVARLIVGGLDPAQALDKAGPPVAAASVRHTLAAGRSVVDTALRADPDARGWIRITGSDPCWFCAMLASRGPVLYRSKASATTRGGTDEPYHDGCCCQAEPVFGTVVLPDSSQRFAELWKTSTAGLSGKAARAAFRRAHQAAAGG